VAVDNQLCLEEINYSYPVLNADMKTGTYPIFIESRQVGELDVCGFAENVSVSVKLIDTFLTIEQMLDLMERLKREFKLPKNQKVSFEQV